MLKQQLQLTKVGFLPRIHHGKHHQAYVNNLNAALEKYPDLQKKNVVELLQDLDAVPEDIRMAVRNNGGGHANHSMFWPCMSPKGGGEPKGSLADAINESFGSFDAFKEQFANLPFQKVGEVTADPALIISNVEIAVDELVHAFNNPDAL